MQVAQLIGNLDPRPIDWISLARKGVSKEVMKQVQTNMGLSQKEIAGLLHLTPRTLQRMADEDLLSPAASGHLLELARIYSRAVDVLGGEDIARQWLHTPIPALNDVAPIALLDTPVGIQWVFTVLGRIEHGLYS